MRTGTFSIPLRGSVLLLALCLLITPLCATRCALASCLPFDAPHQAHGGCHHHGVKSGNADSFFSVLPASCQTTDSLLVALPGQSLRLLPSPSTYGAHVLSAALDLSSTMTPARLDLLNPLRNDSSPGDFSFASSSIPLRI